MNPLNKSQSVFNDSKNNSTNFTPVINESKLEIDSPVGTLQRYIGILELLVFAIGTPANLIVLYLALIRKRKGDVQSSRKGRITKYLIVSMTCSDLLFCLFHSPMMFLVFITDFIYPSGYCLTLFGITHLSTVSSSLSLLLINIDKFLHFRRPLHYAVHVTTRRGVACILACWAVSIGWSLMFIMGPFINYDEQCNAVLSYKSVYVIFAVGFFVIPTLISLMISIYIAIIVFHARIGQKLSERRDRTHAVQSELDSFQMHRHRGSTSSVGKPSTNGFVIGTSSNGNFLTPPPLRIDRIRKSSTFSHGDILSPNHSSKDTITYHRSPKKYNQFRRIGFVFTTTVWTTLTVLPYRVSFIIWNVGNQTNDTDHRRIDQIKIEQVTESGIWVMVFFCLFALMSLNAAGNPFITIMTQRQYSIRLAKLWRCFWRRNALKRIMKHSGDHFYARRAAIHDEEMPNIIVNIRRSLSL